MLWNILQGRADSAGDAPFLHHGVRSISFGEMMDGAARAGRMLEEIGVRGGDKVCLMISNRPEFLELWFGLARIGAVMVPLDAGLRGGLLSRVLLHSGARGLVAENSACLPIGDVARCLPRFDRRIWIGSVEGMPEGFLNYRDAVASLPSAARSPAPPGPSDVMSIVYTAGTTGSPKGVVISHGSYLAMAKAWVDHVLRARPDDVILAGLPLSRVSTQTTMIMASLTTGRPVVLKEGFEASTFFEEVRRRGVTVFDCSKPMIEGLLQLPPRQDDSRHPCRLAVARGVPGGMRREFRARFGIPSAGCFELTECGGPCFVDLGDGAKAGSIGRPLPSYEVRVVDDFDAELPTGISGELVLRATVPDTMFSGYHRDPDRSADSRRNGWFHSGDRGYADEDGDLYHLDRIKECIRRQGETIPSSRIEAVLDSHPKVLESAAIGVLSEPEEEDIKVFVVAAPGVTVSPGELIDWCSERLLRHMVPRYVEFVAELPKTPAGDTRKYELRRRPATGEWDREKVALGSAVPGRGTGDAPGEGPG